MESLTAKRKRIKKQKTKKTLIIVSLFTSLTFGTTVFATSGELENGINSFADGITNLLISEVENKLSIEGSNYVEAILKNINASEQSITSELKSFKELESQRAKEELKSYYEKKVSEISIATLAEIEAGKELIKNQTNASIEKGKADIAKQLKDKPQSKPTETTVEQPEPIVPIESPRPIEVEPPIEPIENNSSDSVSEDPK